MLRDVNPAWWDDVFDDGATRRLLRDVLADRDVSALFRFLKGHEFSWSSIGARTGQQPARVKEIAVGKRRVTDYDVLERICLGLQIPREYMGLGTAAPPAGSSALQIVTEPINVRDFLGVVAAITVGSVPDDIDRWLPEPVLLTAPGTLTDDEIVAVEAVTQWHRDRDAHRGGGACLQSARGYAAWATRLLHAPCHSDTLTRQLHIVLANLHNLVGWLAHDLNHNNLARRHLRFSLLLASNADAQQLAANTLYRLGRISIQEDSPKDALRQFGLGQLAAQNSGCHPSVAILQANIAWANAMLGRADLVTDSLNRAAAERAEADLDTTPSWARFALARADAHGITAVTYTALAAHPHHRGYADTALAEAHQAVKLRDPVSECRSLVFDTISVGLASVLTGADADAGRYGREAVRLAAGGVYSGRVLDRLDRLWSLAAPKAEQCPEIEMFGTEFDLLRNGGRPET